jgi:hypothetical protein
LPIDTANEEESSAQLKSNILINQFMILIFYFNLNYIYEVIKQRIEQEKLSSQMQKSASKGKFSRIKDTGLLSSEEDNDIMSAVTSKQPPSKKTKRYLTTPATHVSLCTISSTQSQLPQSSSSIAHVVLNKAPVANKTPSRLFKTFQRKQR